MLSALRRAQERPPNAQSIIGTLAIAGLPAMILAVIVAKGGGMTNPWVLPLGIITLAINVAIILSDLRYGLVLFIVAAGLSPKLPGLYDNLRVEDFVFVLVFLGFWSRKMQGEKFEKVTSPILIPFYALTVYSAFAFAYGVMMGYVEDPVYGVFLQLKRVEYFFIFYIVVSLVRSEGWLRILTLTFVASGALAAMYGLTNQSSEGSHISTAQSRVQGPEGENYNTLSGYLVICIAAGLAALPAFKSQLQKWFLIACVGIAGAGVIYSFSREGLIMLLGSVLFFGATRHRGVLLVGVVGLALSYATLQPVRENVADTVQQIQAAPTDDPGSNSLSARYLTWRYRWYWVQREPLIGNGVGSVSLSTDNEYLMRACEVGFFGIAIFAWWLVAIGKQVKQLLKAKGLPHMLAIGLASGFTGLLIQGTVAASFTAIRTMEPFWFLLGLTACGFRLYRLSMIQADLEAEGDPDVLDAIRPPRRRRGAALSAAS